ncbi:MAG: hypothetical protein M0R17_02870 [Candidatus Omnitrophica bacterium]|jgi:predicted transcriptional regulator|nr:hypothetical protein [Candidatus Omnitrophota bacterium]
MKLRTGFVSNSSSSSFIIAAIDQNKLKVKVEIEADLSKYLEQTITSEDELWDFIKDRYYDDDNQKEEFIKLNNYLKTHGNIIILNMSSDNYEDPIEQFLLDRGIKDLSNSNITVIEGEGGY